MLEVLKQLQVNPRAAGMQANICNQKMAGDCGFLGSFTCPKHLENLSYRHMRTNADEYFMVQACMLQRFLEKRCKALKYLVFTGKTYSLFAVFSKNRAS